MRTLDILCFGEPLIELARVPEPDGAVWTAGFGGDCSNVAIAAARQGARTGMLTALGDDGMAEDVLGLWAREGVSAQAVRRVPGAPTGAYLIDYGPDGGHRFRYARAGSAASLMSPQDVDADAIASARLLHVSGISQAISPSALEAVREAIRIAHRVGTRVSYDTNLRLSLWGLEQARVAIHAALPGVDLARPSLDDARLLTGLTEPTDILRFYHDLGCKLVVLTLGSAGTVVSDNGMATMVPSFPVNARDASGAGDAFTGAFLTDWLATGDSVAAARYGNAVAALKTLGVGAVAPIPTRAAALAFMADRGG